MLQWYEQSRRHDMPLRPERILYNSRPRLDNRLDQYPCRRHSSSSSRCNSYRDVLLFGSEHFQHHVPEAGYENQKGLLLPFFVCMHGAFQFAWSHLGLALCDWFPPAFTPVCSCHDCGRQEAYARWRGRKSRCSLRWLWASRQLLHIGAFAKGKDMLRCPELAFSFSRWRHAECDFTYCKTSPLSPFGPSFSSEAHGSCFAFPSAHEFEALFGVVDKFYWVFFLYSSCVLHVWNIKDGRREREREREDKKYKKQRHV